MTAGYPHVKDVNHQSSVFPSASLSPRDGSVHDQRERFLMVAFQWCPTPTLAMHFHGATMANNKKHRDLVILLIKVDHF